MGAHTHIHYLRETSSIIFTQVACTIDTMVSIAMRTLLQCGVDMLCLSEVIIAQCTVGYSCTGDQHRIQSQPCSGYHWSTEGRHCTIQDRPFITASVGTHISTTGRNETQGACPQPCRAGSLCANAGRGYCGERCMQHGLPKNI